MKKKNRREMLAMLGGLGAFTAMGMAYPRVVRGHDIPGTPHTHATGIYQESRHKWNGALYYVTCNADCACRCACDCSCASEQLMQGMYEANDDGGSTSLAEESADVHAQSSFSVNPTYSYLY